MEFIDTHCHIHSADYPMNSDEVIDKAIESGVNKLICVGTDENDSEVAVLFAQKHQNIWASVGLHPHDAKLGQSAYGKLESLVRQPKVIAIGECGLDYYYNNSAKSDQEAALRFQIELALAHNLPLIFHIRDAFEQFWPIFDDYQGVKGVVHSFTATTKELEQALDRGLYISLNGIMTFSKNEEQLLAAKQVPLDRLMLETDSPYLTPVPFRGKINEPKNVVVTAEFLAGLRNESVNDLAQATTQNAESLFGI